MDRLDFNVLDLRHMTRLSTDLRDPAARPYFLWDEDTTVGELRSAIRYAEPEEWARLVGKLMREARDPDVWQFVTPRAVWERRALLDRFLGRRRAFWHYLLEGWHRDGFVHDRGPQLLGKVVRDGVSMDPVEEILANKITTLAARSEIRDIVDLYCLEQAGYRIEDHLDAALQKDAGATPATIAWLLSTLRVPERVPGDAPREAIVAYVKNLELRLRQRALPSE